MKVLFYWRWCRRSVLYVVSLSAIILAIIILSVLLHEGKTGESAYPDEVYGVPVHTRLVKPGSPKRPEIKRKIKYVVIHETGNPSIGANAEAHSRFIRQNDETTSWHYTVDDKEIYHHIPDNEVAWHASDRLHRNGGNLNGIGIELCVNRDGDFEKTFKNAAKLTAYLINQYGLSIKDVKQHGDFTDKNCPETIRNEGRMKEFLDLVHNYLEKARSA